MITKDIYDELVSIQNTINRYNKTPAHKTALLRLQNVLRYVVAPMQLCMFMDTAILMYEGKIPMNKYFKTCKSCNMLYRTYKGVGKERLEICKECAKKDIRWCYTHNMLFTGSVCRQCAVDKSHKKYSDTNPDAYVECCKCGFRAPELTSHYIKIHKCTKNEYSSYDIVCKQKRQHFTGENNPAYNHGGRLSPWSKNFKKYSSEEDYIIGVNAIKLKQKETFSKNPQNRNSKLEYYLSKGLTYDAAKIALSDRQSTFSLKKCIERYGDDGYRVWKDRQNRWQTTLNNKPQDEIDLINLKKNVFSIDSYIARGFSEDDAINMLNIMIAKRNIGYSKESIKFFESFIPQDIMQKAYHSESEWFIFDKENKRYFFYDFMYNNTIIEYHGEAYHPNVNILTNDELKTWKKALGAETAYDVIALDERKKYLAETNGFKFFSIYSNDTTDTKQRIKQQVLEALLSE